VALKADVRKDRPDVAVEIDFRLNRLGRAGSAGEDGQQE
jgi:hypothetical protein